MFDKSVDFIKELNNKLILSLDKMSSIGLAKGKMGVSLYFFECSRTVPSYRAIAEKVLEDVLGKLFFLEQTDIEDGFCGISLGLSYLQENKYIKQNLEKNILEIDNIIFKQMGVKNQNYSLRSLIQILYYFYARLSTAKLNKENTALYSELAIKVLNCIHEQLNKEFYVAPYSHSLIEYNLPLFLFVCGKLLELNIYNYKIERIHKEITLNVISTFPYLQSLRLYLLWGMITLNNHLKSDVWENHMNLLYNNINIPYIISKELKYRKIFVDDGATGIYIILQKINKMRNNKVFMVDIDLFNEKIKDVNIWHQLLYDDDFFSLHNNLLYGYLGVLMNYK